MLEGDWYTKGEILGIWSAGTTVGLINDVPTFDELLKTLERDVEDIVGGLNKIIQVAKL